MQLSSCFFLFLCQINLVLLKIVTSARKIFLNIDPNGKISHSRNLVHLISMPLALDTILRMYFHWYLCAHGKVKYYSKLMLQSSICARILIILKIHWYYSIKIENTSRPRIDGNILYLAMQSFSMT
jgi:hypothetical protein